MKTFDDLRFQPHPANINDETKENLIRQGIEPDSDIFSYGEHAVETFGNFTSISVVFGALFYSNGVDTYEAWSSLESDPRGYLTKDEVTELMKMTQQGEITDVD